MKAVAPRRAGGVKPLTALAVAASAAVLIAVLWNFGLLDLSRFMAAETSTVGLVPVPTPALPIPAYTRVTRDHLWDARNGRLAVVYLPPQAVTREMLVRLSDVIGRVLDHEKAPGYVFTNDDFMPDGTREGIVAGIPVGKRALRIPGDDVEGLYGLHAGDRFDLVATMPIDEGRGGGQAFDFGGVYGQQMALQARLSNWQKQATVQVIVQSGVIVEPMTTRQIPVVQTSVAGGAGGRVRTVQEVVIAVDPAEVARLTEAMAVNARIWMVPRSGRPDDALDSVTPELHPVSPFSGPRAGAIGGGVNDRAAAGGASYRVVETVMGQRRELTAVPRP
jgi:Flp pilus assembly protein CpaB